MPEAKLTIDQIEYIRGLCLGEFKYFCHAFLDVKFYDPPFHDPLCDFLQHDPAVDKLIIMPRTHLKTTIAAQMYPLWKSLHNTSLRSLVAGNSSDNAEKTVKTIMSLVESNRLFQALFPEVIPNFKNRSIRWTPSCATLNRPAELPEGTFEAGGIGSNLIRRHYDIIVEDDTVAPKKDEMRGEELMPSRDAIEKAVGFHKLTLPFLLDIENSERIYICTRWASYDVANHIKEKIEEEGVDDFRGFAEYNVPAIKEDGSNSYKRFSLQALDSIRRAMGPYLFNALYLNNPMAPELMTFNPAWVQYYGLEELPTDGSTTICVDPADPPTGNVGQSWSVALPAKNCKSGLYVRPYFREHCSDTKLISATLDIAKREHAIKIRLEVDRYAHMEAAFRMEMKRRGEYYALEPVKTGGRKKEARILRLVPFCENARIHLMRGVMGTLENELAQFPFGTTNDIIDALAWHITSEIELGDGPKVAAKAQVQENTYTLEQILLSTQPKPHHPYPFGAPGNILDRWGLREDQQIRNPDLVNAANE